MRTFLIALVLWPFVAGGQSRFPVVKSEDAPVRAERKAAGHWFIDFGRAAFGHIQIAIPTGVVITTNLIVQLGEAAAGQSAIDSRAGECVRYQRHEVFPSPGQTVSPKLTWQPPGWMHSGWLSPSTEIGEVMPFRYVEIENAPECFSTNWVRRISWSIPFDETASSFKSSSPELDGVWQFCKYSIKATSFLGLYVDGDRERKPYEADAVINQLSHYCVDQRYDTARLTYEYLLKHPTWPTEWRLQSVILAWNDFLWSGDDTSLRRNYDTLKNRAMMDRRTDDGLFRGFQSRGQPPGLEDIVDWPAVERDNYDMQVEVKTVVTAFYYRALVLLQKMAAHLGRTNDAAEFAALAEATRKAVNEKLWDESKGCYVDGLEPQTDIASTHASSHANFFPLALGLVPAERIPRVAAFLKSRGIVCSVYGAQYLLDALYEAGEADYALRLMTTNQLRSWRNMTEKVGSTITLEAWDPSLKPNLDWNHAWGAAPANIISRDLMGIEPIQPGFKRFRVRPQIGSLTQASLKLPSPKGPITLAINRFSGGQWQANVCVPKSTAAEFHLPAASLKGVWLSSGQPKKLREENGRVVIELKAGRHHITVDSVPNTSAR